MLFRSLPSSSSVTEHLLLSIDDGIVPIYKAPFFKSTKIKSPHSFIGIYKCKRTGACYSINKLPNSIQKLLIFIYLLLQIIKIYLWITGIVLLHILIPDSIKIICHYHLWQPPLLNCLKIIFYFSTFGCRRNRI